MRHAIVAIISVLVLTLFSSAALIGATNTSAAPAEPVSCQVVAGQTTRVVCKVAGVVVLNTVVTLPTVTLPPIQLPGSTETVRITVPPLPAETTTRTETVTIPAETQTITVEGPTNTVTVTEGQTFTLEPTAAPSQPRQTVTEYATVGPDEGSGKDTYIPLPNSLAGKAVLGTLSLIALVGIILLGMYGGYYIGYKDSDESSVKFLKALRDNIASRNNM